MLKRCFFITGVESGGNHITTRFFCYAGCLGEYRFSQPLDEFALGRKSLDKLAEKDREIVYNRPTGGRFPDLLDISNRFKKAGYEVIWILPERRIEYIWASRKKRGIAVILGKDRIIENYKHIIKEHSHSNCKLWKFPMTLIYENPDKLIKLLKDCFQLDVDIGIKKYLYNGDAAYEKSLNN